MTTLKFEDNKIYSTSALCERTDVFEIVDLHPEDKDNFEINLTTLKAVKVAPNEWEKLNKAASWGIGNLKQAEKALKSKRHGYTADRKRDAAELTIDIFRRICK